MPDYFDAYLAPLIDKTPEYTTRAEADVEQLGTFPEAWTARLIVLRTYILCCLESNAADDDVFTVKLKQYQTEWKAVLAGARAAANLAALPGVASCKIGLEANIVPDDYPLIRLVPSTLKPSAVWPRQQMDVLIYGGVDHHAFEGLDVVYAALFALESAIRARMEQGGDWVAVWQETLWDEDRLPHYKLFAMRWRVEG